MKWGPIAAVLVGLSAFILPAILIGLALAAFSEDSFSVFYDSLSTNSRVLINILSATGGLAIIWVYIRKKGGLKALGFRKNAIDKLLSRSVLGYIVYFATTLVTFALLALTNLIDLDQEQDLGLTSIQGFEWYVVFLGLVVVAPIFEEVLFRGFIYQGFKKVLPFWPAALMSSLIFALAHGQLNVAVDTFILAMVATWLFNRYNNIYPAILIHMLKNAVAFAFLL
mgnify:CR=1 FL=1